MFRAALFVTAKTWNQPRCLIWYIGKQTMVNPNNEYYSIKKEKPDTHKQLREISNAVCLWAY